MKNNIIIVAGGDGTRWNNYLGVKKHKVKIDGEELINRTCRLFNSSTIIEEKYNETNTEVDKLLATKKYWKDRTIILFGDVYFTEDAIKKILENQEHSLVFFERKGPSVLT